MFISHHKIQYGKLPLILYIYYIFYVNILYLLALNVSYVIEIYIICIISLYLTIQWTIVDDLDIVKNFNITYLWSYRDRPQKLSIWTIELNPGERSKLKWDMTTEIDAFYKNQKSWHRKPKKSVKRLSLQFLVGSDDAVSAPLPVAAGFALCSGDELRFLQGRCFHRALSLWTRLCIAFKFGLY